MTWAVFSFRAAEAPQQGSSSRFSSRNRGRTKSESNLCCAADRRTA
nr:MAG TPA: hypothetical protein [Caudoviricetes sp.]